MFLTPLIAFLLAGSGAAASTTPADLSNCVRDKASELAMRSGRSDVLAGQAFAGCKARFEELAVRADAAAAAAGEPSENRQVNRAAWRESVRKALLDLAVSTIRERRAAR